MTEDQRDLVLRWMRQEISKEELLDAFEGKRDDADTCVVDALRAALAAKEARELWDALHLGNILGFPEASIPIFFELIREDWHDRYDEISFVLQKMRFPSSVEGLYEAVLLKIPHCEDIGPEVFRNNCMWALYDIGTDEAKEKLQVLAKSEIESVREDAQEKLDEWELSGGKRFEVWSAPFHEDSLARVSLQFGPWRFVNGGQTTILDVSLTMRIEKLSETKTEGVYRFEGIDLPLPVSGEFVFDKTTREGRLTKSSPVDDPRSLSVPLRWVGQYWAKNGVLPDRNF